MKYLKCLVVVMVLFIGGCMEFKGVSIGLTRLDTSLKLYGQEVDIKEFMPIILLNWGN